MLDSRMVKAFVVVIGTGWLIGCGEQSADEGTQSREVADDPQDYVQTPAGWYHRSCVHAIPDEARVDENGRVTLPDGTVREWGPCRYPKRDVARMRRGDRQVTTDSEPTNTGWIEASDIYSADGYRQMEAYWTVPSAPVYPYFGNNQTIFMFPGLEPADSSVIIQPVLQYGVSAAGGGNYWTIASWSCGSSSSNCYHGSLRQVSPGHAIYGSMYASNCDGAGTCDWGIVTQDQSSGAISVFSTRQRAMTWAFGGALEVYNLPACSYYPPNGPTTLSNIALYDQNYNPVTTYWGGWVANTSPQCNFDFTAAPGWTSLYYTPFTADDGSGLFQGCFEDSGARALPVSAGSSGGMTPAYCRALCGGYTYAGVQYYNQCFCGNSLGYGQRPRYECNTACSGDAGVACGGAWRNSIYATGTGGGGAVTFYDDIYYGGASFSASSDVDFVGWDWNDRISSIRIPPGRTVVLYQDWYFGGASLTLTGDVADLRDYGWNDWASSMQIW